MSTRYDLACEQDPRTHTDTSGAGTCGGTLDEPCAEPAAWRIDRPWGGTTTRGYCSRHTVARLHADQVAEQMHQKALADRGVRRAHA